MTTRRSILIGFFFLFTLCVLGYYTLFLTNFTLFTKQPELVIQFEEANALREGDPILVAGVRWGRVKSLTFDPRAPLDRRITVTAVLDNELILREGFAITIRDSTILGGKSLSIDPGPPEGVAVPPDRPLFGNVASNPLNALGDVVAENRALFSEIMENIAEATRALKSGDGTAGLLLTNKQVADNLAAAVDAASKMLVNVEKLSSDVVQGRGTAGKLFADQDLYDEWTAVARRANTLLEELNGLAGDARRGDGLVQRLMSDPKLASDVADSVASVRAIVTRVERGEGTLGQLLVNDAIAKSLENVMRRIENGEGTIGALLTRDQLYDNLVQISEDFAAITTTMREGRGTIGQLVMNEDLYRQLETAMRIVQRSLEEFREAAPVTTFTSVFFGAF